MTGGGGWRSWPAAPHGGLAARAGRGSGSRAPGGANQAAVSLNGPHPRSSWKLAAPGASRVVLAGRATIVPFTAVLAGPERTAADDSTAAVTCAAPRCPGRDPAGSGFASRGCGRGLASALPCPAGRSVLVAEDGAP